MKPTAEELLERWQDMDDRRRAGIKVPEKEVSDWEADVRIGWRDHDECAEECCQ